MKRKVVYCICLVQANRLIASMQGNQIATSACGLLAMTLYVCGTLIVIDTLFVIARSRRFACDVAIWFSYSELNRTVYGSHTLTVACYLIPDSYPRRSSP